MNFVLGFFAGSLTLFLLSFLFKRRRIKKGRLESESQSKLFTTKIKDTIRHIIFEYSVKRHNNDFLLNISFKGETFMQLMHRTHFSELCTSEEDLEFGLALYIPIRHLRDEQLSKLKSILIEESVRIDQYKKPVTYYVIDLEQRIRYGGYLVSRITKELFNPDDNDISLELFSEGALPYSGDKKGFSTSN